MKVFLTRIGIFLYFLLLSFIVVDRFGLVVKAGRMMDTIMFILAFSMSICFLVLLKNKNKVLSLALIGCSGLYYISVVYSYVLPRNSPSGIYQYLSAAIYFLMVLPGILFGIKSFFLARKS